jgi:alpha-glucosidase
MIFFSKRNRACFAGFGAIAAFWSGGCQPSHSATVSQAATSGLNSRTMQVGNFIVRWDNSNGSIDIANTEAPQRSVWRTPISSNFITIANDETNFEQVRGSITTHEKISQICQNTKITAVLSSSDSVVVQGELSGNCEARNFVFKLKPTSPNTLSFDARIVPEPGTRMRTFLRYQSEAGEGFFGFGEQYSEFNMKGKRLPLLLQEQGHGRGLQPLSTAINLASKGSAGDWHTTYAPSPQYISSKNRGLYLENYEPSTFDFTKPNEVQIEVLSGNVRGGILSGTSPLNLISEYTKFSGRMRPLPAWANQGAIVGIQGGESFVRKTVAKLESQGVPISAIWLQDWVGQRHTTAGERLWWNWEVDLQSYPNWGGLVKELKAKGYRVLGYVNPFLSDASTKLGVQKNYFLEAKMRNFLVKHTDGTVVMIDTAGFSGAMVDLSNPQARIWLKDIIKKNLIGYGLSGWMADFGEAIPLDAAPHSKENPLAFHSQYVEEWAKISKEAMEESGLKDDGLFFVRSGYARSPGIANLFWVGDQMVSWDEYDGIKTTIIAMMSSGISGFSLNHSDIGGCIALTLPVLTFKRTDELLRRWMELNAFTPVFRTHEGTNPIKGGAQAYDSVENIRWLKYYAFIYSALGEYRQELMKEASEKGWPMIRAPFLHYPNDPKIFSQRYEFLLGSSVLVSPVLDPGKTTQQVYLPPGIWTHIWSKKTYGNEQSGTTITVDAPIGKPPVFFKTNQKILERALERIQHISNSMHP